MTLQVKQSAIEAMASDVIMDYFFKIFPLSYRCTSTLSVFPIVSSIRFFTSLTLCEMKTDDPNGAEGNMCRCLICSMFRL